MAKTLPKHIVRKVYRINELVYQAQSLQEEVEEWLEKNVCGRGEYSRYSGFDFMNEYANSVADSFEAEMMLEAMHEAIR